MLVYARACVSVSMRYRSGENNYMQGYIIYTYAFVFATAIKIILCDFCFKSYVVLVKSIDKCCNLDQRKISLIPLM